MPQEQSRRAFLGTLGAAMTGTIAGCQAPQNTETSTERSADETQRTTSTAAGSVYTKVYRKAIDSVVLIRVYDENGPKSQGSGFVYDNQHVITNQHVVDDAEEIRVQFKQGEWTTASVAGSDVYSDLAALRLPKRPEYATPLSFVKQEPPIGTRVVVLGAPFGLGESVSAGIISGQDRSLPSGTGFHISDAVQTDAAVNPGNSGGPLLTLEGDVAGVISAGGGENIGFAISAALTKRVMPELIRTGEYEHAYMGVRIVGVTPLIAEANDLERARGVLVVDVMDGGPSSGVLQGSNERTTIRNTEVPVGGDIIVAIDDTPIPTQSALGEYLALHTSPGDTISVTVLRDDKEKTVELTLGKRPEQQ